MCEKTEKPCAITHPLRGQAHLYCSGPTSFLGLPFSGGLAPLAPAAAGSGVEATEVAGTAAVQMNSSCCSTEAGAGAVVSSAYKHM